MTRRQLFIAWLRLCAFVLDRLGRRHSIRRRLGQLRRVRVIHPQCVCAETSSRNCAIHADPDDPLAEQQHNYNADIAASLRNRP